MASKLENKWQVEIVKALLRSLDREVVEEHDLGQGHDAETCYLCQARAFVREAS